MPRLPLSRPWLLVLLSDFEVSSLRLFRYQSMWLEHFDFIAIVCRIWSSHVVGRHPQYCNVISAISINGVFSEDRRTIRDHIIGYYSYLFSLNVSRVGRDLSIVYDVIPSLVTAVENVFLTSVPSADEIHDAVFATDATSAHGPDGFSGRFYQRCWDVVGSDVVLAVQDFHHWSYFPWSQFQLHCPSSEVEGLDFD
ncbi:hypothetical protein Dsin_016523 [Dipteronia sinensis]|uniref:Uncharacterized protein n=1 Tax=Dipteronia sinensis TaxID=43782 RepID=A0AAE0AEJ0_9ROSI|nr:hypothetical protein Dsin_016523 [Dipteronia sinensis]